MKSLLIVGLLITICSFSTQAQYNKKINLEREGLDTIRFYTSIQAGLNDPESVIRLKLEGERLKELSNDILQFKNLKELNLNNNKLKAIPDWLSQLSHLERLDIGDNKLKEVPTALKGMKNLKRLRLGDNNIDSLPAFMAQMKSLEFIDLWANPISHFDAALHQMKNLKQVDLRVIMLSPEEQEFIVTELWPEATVVMDRPCDCNRNMFNKDED